MLFFFLIQVFAHIWTLFFYKNDKHLNLIFHVTFDIHCAKCYQIVGVFFMFESFYYHVLLVPKVLKPGNFVHKHCLHHENKAVSELVSTATAIAIKGYC